MKFTSVLFSISILVVISCAYHSYAGVVYQYNGGYITFLANRAGSNSDNWKTNLPIGFKSIKPADEYYLDFWLKYRPGWIEGEGGKIAGLAGGNTTTGCDKIVPDGWSVRYMWDSMRAYLYHQDRQSACGDGDSFSPQALSVDVWHRLTKRVKVNTPNAKNGEVEIWVDGKQAYLRTNLRLRGNVSSSTARVDRVIIQPFRGGPNGDLAWAVSRDTTIDFSKFYILDCKPNFSAGGPTAEPVCGEKTSPYVPTNLRIIGVQ